MAVETRVENTIAFTGLLSRDQFEKYVLASDFIFVMKVDPEKDRLISCFGEKVDLSRRPRCAVFDVTTPQSESVITVKENTRILWINGAKVSVFFEYTDGYYGFSTGLLVLGEIYLVGEKRYPRKTFVYSDKPCRYIDYDDLARQKTAWEAEKLTMTAYERKIAEMNNFIPSLSSQNRHIFCKAILNEIIYAPYVKQLNV